MPFIMSFAREPAIVTLAWNDNVSVAFPLNIDATKGLTRFEKWDEVEPVEPGIG